MPRNTTYVARFVQAAVGDTSPNTCVPIHPSILLIHSVTRSYKNVLPASAPSANLPASPTTAASALPKALHAAEGHRSVMEGDPSSIETPMGGRVMRRHQQI